MEGFRERNYPSTPPPPRYNGYHTFSAKLETGTNWGLKMIFRDGLGAVEGSLLVRVGRQKAIPVIIADRVDGSDYARGT